jgi:hypothetical protein
LVLKENDPTINAEIEFWINCEFDTDRDSYSQVYMPFLALIITEKKKNIHPCWAWLIMADMMYLKLQPNEFFVMIAKYYKS